jgi:hypothetical protein
MRGMIPYAELDRALRRWKVRKEGGTPVEEPPPVEEPVTEVTADAVVSAEVYMETSAETRAVETAGLMPVVQFDRE